ncbi:hypothetical protein DFH09DRAFT_918693 [Mycena vulgaris]|nr:hypothetical protein DFH09DRAFT_918693 [Mycena vulgaris]
MGGPQKSTERCRCKCALTLALPTLLTRAQQSSVHSSRRTTLYKVQSAIRQKYGKKYSVELFGSTRYGISSASSDLDMVVLDPDRPHGYAPGAIEPTTRLLKVARVLYKAGFKIIDSIPQASVPIGKASLLTLYLEPTDTRTGHSCDLNINDRLGLLNSDLIKRYCELNPVLTDMLKYIKKWAKPLGLNSPSADKKGPITFSSYALVMMTIGFLQAGSSYLIPSPRTDCRRSTPGTLDGTFWLHKPRIIRCDARYNRAEDWSPPEYVPVHELMRDWFKFWGGEFNFEEETISIRHGGRILRSSLEEGAEYRGILWNIDPFIQSKVLHVFSLEHPFADPCAESHSESYQPQPKPVRVALSQLRDAARFRAR